jgi:hypothetical protein
MPTEPNFPVLEPHHDLVIFLSASIPDPRRWQGAFDPLEITDAVVSLARVFLTARAQLVSGAHPTISPLLLYVASELGPQPSPQVRIYQSQLFEDRLPEATRRFEAQGVGTLVWTQAAIGDYPEPGKWDNSLDIMRRRMLHDTDPFAAIFVGGMAGIQTEFQLFTAAHPDRPTYALGRPGGEARSLVQHSASPLRERLMTGDVYPSLWQAVLQDILLRTQRE